MVFPFRLRVRAAMLVMAGLFGLGCHKGTNPANLNISGMVTFVRPPVQYDPVSGSPTGYGSTGVVYPGRNLVVKAFFLDTDIGADGLLHQNWRLGGSTVTDDNGNYSIGGLVVGYSTFIEVDSIFQQTDGDGATVQVIADPDGIGSSLPEPQRPIYAYRVDVAGVPVPGQNPVAANDTTIGSPVAVLNASTFVNPALTTNDVWAVTLPNWYVPGTNPSPTQPQSPPIGTQAVGSEVLGILDSVFLFSAYYGDPTPSRVKGGVLDLHYYPGRTESPRRSYVLYDLDHTPNNFDGTKEHYFGTLAGGPAVDDGWDPGVIYPMLARNFLYGQGKTALFPTGTTSLASEAPDLAIVDGLADGMAATLLTSPWLTDTTAAAGLAPRDIRVIPAQAGFTSPATIAAASWQLTLAANGLASPGSYAEWQAGMTNPAVLARLYNLIYPTFSFQGARNIDTIQTDVSSMFTQVGRLQEPIEPGEPVDLRTIFNNTTLLVLLQPYGVLWPQLPAEIPAYAVNWTPNTLALGPDSSTTPLPPFTLSMADAVQVPNPQLPTTAQPTPPALVYPNVTQGEVAYAKFYLTYDRGFNLSVNTVPALSTTSAVIEFVVDGQVETPYLFGSGYPSSYTFTLAGNTTDVTNPLWHFVRIRVLSPTVQQPDLQTTVNLAWNHNP